MPTVTTIEDVSNIRSISAAVTANAGAIAIQNINGALKQVDDQGTVTSIGGGAGTVTTSAPASGTGTALDPVTVVAASGSVAGSMSAANFAKLAALYLTKAGTALTDANQTVQPFTDKASAYVQLTALTASRTKTLGVTTVVTGTTVYIIRADSAAFTMPIANGGTNGGTLFTFGASPTEIQGVACGYNGVDWVLLGFVYLTN